MMRYKSLLMHVDQDPLSSPACRLAPALIKRFDPHLTGLVLSVMPSLPGYAYHPMVSDALAVQNKAVRKEAEANAAAFRALIERNAAAGECRLEDCLSSDCVEVIGLHGRYSDLIVMNQNEPDRAEAWASELPARVALTAGRPVLIAPQKDFSGNLGGCVTLAWNASQQAARAVGDALPFLITAELVKIVTYDAEASAVGHGADPGADIGLYLSRHGCKVEVHARDSGDVGVADCILSFLVEHGSDLLVMGAYGQSRFREKVFGGVTERILAGMTLPVLLSH